MGTDKTKRAFEAKHASNKQAIEEFSDWDNNKLIRYILKLRKSLQEAEEKLKENEFKTSTSTKSPDLVFKKTWTFATKIHFLLFKEQKPLTSEELSGLLLKVDSKFKNYSDKRLFLANYLTRLVKIKRFRKVKQPGMKLNLYLLPEWFDADGNVKQEYAAKVDIFS